MSIGSLLRKVFAHAGGSSQHDKKPFDTNHYIYKLLKGEPDTESQVTFVFCGNDADEENGLDVYGSKENVETFHHLGGRFDLSVLVRLSEQPSAFIVKKCFLKNDATFLGYYARKKVDQIWNYFCVDGNWHAIAADMPRKQLIEDGSSCDFLIGDCSETILLEAQWENEDGVRMDCGYEMFSNSLMAHAFGGMNGKTYHNTMPALQHGIKEGYQYFEVDFTLTSDGRMVLCHGWSKANCKHTGFDYQDDFSYMPYKRLMKMRVHGNPITDARQFYQYMKKHSRYNFEADFHNLAKDPAYQFTKVLVKDFQYDREVLDHFLVQAYSKNMYEGIDQAYHFRHYQYLVGKNIDRLDDIITYSLDHGICVLALRTNLAKPKFIRQIRKAGLYVMAYTLNSDLPLAHKLLSDGVNTLCTDYVTSVSLKKSYNPFGKNPFYVWYNSNCPDVECQYETTDDAKLVCLKSGNYEWHDNRLWHNDGKRMLEKCEFTHPTKRFVGWHLRMKVDGKQLWYCKNHCYHTKGDFVKNTDTEPYLFMDEETLPIWTCEDKIKYIMVAVWEEKN